MKNQKNGFATQEYSSYNFSREAKWIGVFLCRPFGKWWYGINILCDDSTQNIYRGDLHAKLSRNPPAQ